jgi:hypothetical protein
VGVTDGLQVVPAVVGPIVGFDVRREGDIVGELVPLEGAFVGVTDGGVGVGALVGTLVERVGDDVGDQVAPPFVGAILGFLVGLEGDCVGVMVGLFVFVG